MTNLSKLFDSLQKNIVFVLVSLVLMAVVYFIAFGFEKLIERRTILSSHQKNQSKQDGYHGNACRNFSYFNVF